MNEHIKKMQRIDFFEPRIGFPVLFIVLVVVGANKYFPSLEDYEVTTKQWIYYCLGLAIYYNGVFLAEYLFKGRKNIKADITYYFIDRNRSCLGESDNVLLVLCIIALICFGLNYVSTASKVAFDLSDIEEFRVAFVDNSNALNTLYNLAAKLVIIFAGMKLLINYRTSYLTIITLVISIILLNILLVRGNIFMTLLLLMIIYNYVHKRVSLKIILVSLLVALIIFAVIGTFRIQAIAESPLVAELGGTDSLYSLYAAHLLDYVQWGPKALAFLMEIIPNKIDYYYGFDTLSPLYNVFSHLIFNGSGGKYLPQFIVMDLLGYEQEMGQGLAVGMTTHFYIDGGLTGILIGYFLIGFILETLYGRMNKNRNKINVFFYAYFLQAAFWGLYAHIFNGISDLLLPLLAYILFKMGRLNVTEVRTAEAA